MIIGEMRTTSTKVLELFLDLPTCETALLSTALMAAYHLPKPDPINLRIGRNQMWAKINKVGQFDMKKDHITLRRKFNKYRITIPTKENWPNWLRKGRI